MSGVMIELLNSEQDQLFKIFTDENGIVNQNINIPTAYTGVTMRISHIGLPEYFWLEKSINGFSFDYSGELTSEHLVIDNELVDQVKNNAASTTSSRSQNATIVYHGTYDSNGVPSYLEASNDVVSSELLTLINASLPENQPVPDFHPTYLADGKQTSIDIVDQADVWLTFVHEGAGWRNAIAYYTYPTNAPPLSSTDISSIIVLFPNLSFSGSGGGLQSGNKVHLGVFEPGTSIGLALLANGWDGTNSEDFNHIIYSNKAMNPEPEASLQQHNVLLYDEQNSLFLVGFEDIRRDDIPFQCDQDFNDAILYFSSNPITAISTENVNPIDQPIDQDGDGVSDVYDEYPSDPLLAYNNYYPSENAYGTFSFEDNWPDLGDYDFNDLVMDYRYTLITNAQNKIAKLQGDFKVMALGAGYRNGFGFSTNLLPGDIQSVTGNVLNAGYIQVNGNGTEANQSKAVFIVADNLHSVYNTSGFINTDPALSYQEPVSISLSIDLNSPQTNQTIGLAPYNPFLIISQERGREVHLPSYLPTDLVDTEYFGTNNDNTDVAQGRYYQSKTDLPWAINLPVSFDYPIENSDVRDGHLMFSPWNLSSGFSYMDWYEDKSGYRNLNRLYRK
jgi:LruC domain-containing protein